MIEEIELHPIRFISFYLDNIFLFIVIMSMFILGFFTMFAFTIIAFMVGLVLTLCDLLFWNIEKRNKITIDDKYLSIHKGTLWGEENENVQLSSIKDIVLHKESLLESIFDYGSIDIHLHERESIHLLYIKGPESIIQKILDRSNAGQ